MSIFTQDTSTQGTGSLSTYSKSYSTRDYPFIRLYTKSGVYNPSDNVIKFFTNNLDALTIDASQRVICNGSLITNLEWNNINNKPSFFDGSYNVLTNRTNQLPSRLEYNYHK